MIGGGVREGGKSSKKQGEWAGGAARPPGQPLSHFSEGRGTPAQVETECKETIATSAGPNVSPADVSVTLSAGSLQVAYSIIVDADDASSISSAISTAVESGTLVDSLVTNLQTIPNIGSIVSGTLWGCSSPSEKCETGCPGGA